MNDSSLPKLPCMCGNFRRTSRALNQLYEKAFRPLGMRGTQFTILQALSLAGGLQHSARQGHARLIRQTEGTAHEEQLNLGEIQKGKLPNPTLYPGDILYVPFSWAKNLITTGAPGMASSAASAAIYAAP